MMMYVWYITATTTTKTTNEHVHDAAAAAARTCVCLLQRVVVRTPHDVHIDAVCCTNDTQTTHMYYNRDLV